MRSVKLTDININKLSCQNIINERISDGDKVVIGSQYSVTRILLIFT